MDFTAARNVLSALEKFDVKYVVFGGIALNLHGLSRFTQDLDIFIAPTVENIDRLKDALRSVYDDPQIDEITAADLLGEYPAVQYVPPAGPFHVDILTRLGEAYRFEDIETERVPFEDLVVNVASARTLYQMKRGTVRPKDWSDAAALKRHFQIEDD